MIRDMDHAIRVQRRRFQAGRTGIAKAVRRYLRRVHSKRYDVEAHDLVLRARDGGR